MLYGTPASAYCFYHSLGLVLHNHNQIKIDTNESRYTLKDEDRIT